MDNYQSTQKVEKSPVVFSKEDTLGGVVSERALVCNLGVQPILNFEKTLQYSCGFDKLGFLCGFKFTSSKPVSNKTFFVVFVPKLKSSIMRQQRRGSSSWYVWEYIDSTSVNVLSQALAMTKYGFDIDKFFQSDLFKRALPQFQKAVDACLSGEVAEHLQTLRASGNPDDHTRLKELERYVKSIVDSLPTLVNPDAASRSFNLGNSGDGERKIYRAAKSYELDHFQKRKHDEEAQKMAADFKTWLAARNAAQSKSQQEKEV